MVGSRYRVFRQWNGFIEGFARKAEAFACAQACPAIPTDPVYVEDIMAKRGSVDLWEVKDGELAVARRR